MWLVGNANEWASKLTHACKYDPRKSPNISDSKYDTKHVLNKYLSEFL